MTLGRLALRSATYHWRTNTAVVLGVAAAVSVLAGALLVGESVRASLRELALGRLGRTDYVVSSTGFFREALAADIHAGAVGAAPLLTAAGFVTHERSGRGAGSVLVYGVDERFWIFHGVVPPGEIAASPRLAADLGAAPGDVLLVRLQQPSHVPAESLFGRKDDIARTVRLDLADVLPRERLGEFSLQPQQSEVRALFVPLQRLQRDLGLAGRANTLLVSGGDETFVRQRVRAAYTLDDFGVRITPSAAGSREADLGMGSPGVMVEARGGILAPLLEAAARRAGEQAGLLPLPVFSYLANTMRRGDRAIAYSLIAALDLSVLPLGASRAPDLSVETRASRQPDAIVLNAWAAKELGASPGDRVDVDYYLWDPAHGLTAHTAAFTVEAVTPMEGVAADRHLVPEYPGITGATHLSDWDPPFPIDLSRIGPRDEAYWDQYRTTPKAFIPYERGRELWQTRYGAATSIRFAVAWGTEAAVSAAARIEQGLLTTLAPEEVGVAFRPVRRQVVEASKGATDFGEYFTYFSFFIVISALLLAVLFFRLGVEQRLRQVGILRASGFPQRTVRVLLLSEAVVLAAFGSILGAAGAVGYAQAIVYGLRTWWVGAVGTTLLHVHVSWWPLAAGAVAGLVAAAVCVVLSLRTVARMSPRALLGAQALDSARADDGSRTRRRRALAIAFGTTGIAMLGVGFIYRDAQTGMFFGAGAALLAACMFLLAAWLGSRDVVTTNPLGGRGAWPVARLGFRSAAYRPSRSVLSAVLIASATFVIVSVDAFRQGGTDISDDVHSGTGAFALIGQSEIPLLQNLNDAAGREAAGVSAPEFDRLRFTRFRMRPGEDASCLNLYRPASPVIVAPEPGFIEAGRFTFASSLAQAGPERANPWLLLRQSPADGTIPVIADATSLQYVLHAAVGDTFALDTGAAEPVRLRFVASLSGSVLQGQLVMSEEHFVRLFPAVQGYRFFLIDVAGVRFVPDASTIAGVIEKELGGLGFDAVVAAQRLAAFHQVENTYLSTFQALGGLGLLLGTIGLAAVMFRNVLERRRELALLRAVGYNARHVSIVVLAESAFLLACGLGSGAACAALAVAPAWFARGGTRPGLSLAVLLVAVALAGLLSSLVATRAALRGNLLAALRAE